MSQFRPYPAYKDSGVEWLGEVPESWGVRPLKWLVEQVTDKAGISDFQVGLENIEGWTGRFIETDSEFSGDGIAFRREDILFGKLRPYLAKVWLADKAGQAVGDFFVLRPRAINGEFLHKYILTPTVIDDLNASTIGAKMPRVGWEDMAALAVTLPSHDEQTKIARFLDHETARIDALIEEQQRLIELLKEKRQAVISHAVTKGLDPTVPMKDSGVEWLGGVPAHWDVCAVRRVICAVEQGWSPECEAYPADEDAWGILKAGCVNRGVFNPLENKTLPPSLKPIAEYEVRAGDILMSRASGSPELVGSTALLGEIREKLMLSDKIFRIHLEQKISSTFFVWVMNAQFMRAQIEQALSGGNGLANNLPQSSLLAFLLAVPPSSEQYAIADFIDDQTRALDTLISEGRAVIGFLQERRSALISAAVTGKIDVRGWQRPTSVSSPVLEEEAV